MSSASQTNQSETRIESIQLMDGRRVFRVFDALTGLCLERTADPSKPIRQQTEKLTEALHALRSMPVCTAA